MKSPRPFWPLFFLAAFAVVQGTAADQAKKAGGNPVKHTRYGSTIEEVASPRTAMTVREARKALTTALNRQFDGRTARAVVFGPDRVDFTIVAKEGRTQGSVLFAELRKVAVESNRYAGYKWCQIRAQGKDLTLGENHSACFENYEAAMLFVDAVLNLKAAKWVPDIEETDFAEFTAGAKAWLATTPKPEMSSEARTFKLVAEDAFKRKDFAASLEAYREALEKFPMWPEGHYNAALLAAETEDYGLATAHMRRYLVLASDAKDAPDAKDKLLLWQFKAKQ